MQAVTINFVETTISRFPEYKNHVYKNVEAQKCLFFKNIIAILSVSISFEPQDEI